ncbi:hypothetical protein BU23DRAFT_549906 [Bimuria novae-zelandiae CBS 107.79]|uniref:Mid2 domain-containing protein n=1 Tax=Bimuria novae-zelandiae CBS 107.79 TaxID=1447943 RepID=A0A6A5VME1_9PLEO|nr:hypothetical protein BU23DRAFT_549906 [Bimuria novae-zelandiae CBS 107.79]
MVNQEALDVFNPTCEDGAKYYACEATSSNRSPFVGCCRTDPCSISGCAQGNLAPVSFNASAYDTIGAGLPDPTCPSASNFFTCVNIPKNDTTFWGCCKTNPCQTTDLRCPKNDQTPATLDTQNQQLAYTGKGASSDEKDGGSSNTGAIIGGAVGGGVAVVAIIAILIFCLFKKRRARKQKVAARPVATEGPGLPTSEKTEYRHSTMSEGTMPLTTPGASMSPSEHGRRQDANGLEIMSNGTSAPPLYQSPKQPFAAQFGQHQYQQVGTNDIEPVEMPADSSMGPTQRYSELPAEASNKAPVEMESPMMSPYLSPKPSPRVPQSPLSQDGRPRTADRTYRVSMGNLGSPT